jgi:hypothetical protein
MFVHLGNPHGRSRYRQQADGYATPCAERLAMLAGLQAWGERMTGHTNLTSRSIELVRHELLDALRPHASDLVGLTCLARGADQAFADAVLELGGALEVVVPAADYFTGISDPVSRERCDAYLAAAASTVTMPFETSGSSAYLAASEYLIDRCDLLLAVWDGAPATGSGGTADAVAYARERRRSITIVWPEGAQRA